ncbi:NlpC/P60 family protein [Streptomyces sp. NPDC089919]|uniref:C40 family peptidase n=1 Tax=Streptomyces sp. NPDC089919 TaxID=3155188 RepID=UPI00342FC333
MNRRRGASALTLICAMAILSAPGLAHAVPAPEPAPGATSLEDVRKQIEDLYHKAATATDAYNLAEEEAKKQSDRIVFLANQIVAGKARITELKNRAGAAARAQYRSGGLPPGATLALSNDPQQFLDGADRLRQGEKATMGVLGELNATQADLQRYAAEASSRWQTLESNRIKKDAAKKEIESKIAAAKALENRLLAEERARLLKLEQDDASRKQTRWLKSGALKDINSKASAAGKLAIAYATRQMGKPYIWGAEGPRGYDCSGLTSQAWLAAGHPIPRTSQEQLRLLPHVPIDQMRPGDLIIYFDDASHVAMYIGDGAMIHAPRPGRFVTVAGAGSMPIKAVVRPDA